MLGELTNKDKNYRVLFSCIVSGIITCFLFLGFGEIISLLQKALDEKENQTKCLHDIERLMKEKKHLPNKGGFFYENETYELYHNGSGTRCWNGNL